MATALATLAGGSRGRGLEFHRSRCSIPLPDAEILSWQGTVRSDDRPESRAQNGLVTAGLGAR